MTFKLLNHRVEAGLLVFTIQRLYFGFIPLWTKEFIQTENIYKYTNKIVWKDYKTFKSTGAFSDITSFCNDEHDRLLHERVYDEANNKLHRKPHLCEQCKRKL